LRSHPLTIADERPLFVTASVGIAAVTSGSDLTPSELLVEADVAMYDAKEAGRDRICHVDLTAGRSGRLRSRLTWSQRIREALDSDRFELWEQPIITMANGETDRSEILLRMLGDDGEPVPPGVFLYIAEHFGQIQAIDRWVIDRSIRLLAERKAAGEDAHLEVNLSGASITDADLTEFIVDRVRNAPIDPTRLTFEVTETTAIVNIERAREFARRLAELGCRFALDDFGAGFGSFYYLKHLPFDLVKIDGDFIKNLPQSKTDQLTVQAIVQIAKGLGKQTVAEFVGDQPTMDLLRTYGVDYGQGYHLGRPKPARPPLERTPAGVH
jgi:EAL domain-containing protein (putative c-di-GMP-specific phosphodiesterase class I)